jgi:sigma54-dependent transcription regulator
MRKDDVIAVIGSAAAVGRLLEITHQAVSAWPKTVPRLRQYELRELRPSIDQEIERLRRVNGSDAR